jgi:hypothetical protein
MFFPQFGQQRAATGEVKLLDPRKSTTTPMLTAPMNSTGSRIAPNIKKLPNMPKPPYSPQPSITPCPPIQEPIPYGAHLLPKNGSAMARTNTKTNTPTNEYF